MKVLALTTRSVTLELEKSERPYYADKEFSVYINGEFLRKERRNVFSVFGLQPAFKYEISAGEESVKIKLPPEYASVNVISFGAKGDGTADDTAAFQTAVNIMPYGSVICVPQGVYKLKPLFLKSGITIYLEKGAILKGSADRADYPILRGLADGINFGTWQGEEADCFASLLTAYGQKDIKIIGEGVIDCNALAGDWYVNHRVMRGAWRPRGVFLNRCENVLMQGITVKNTPSWNIHPYFCTNVKLYNLTLENPPDMPTTDGIDPDCCNNVEIAGADISVGDDCIAIKSGTLEFAQKYKTACKNIEIRNCLMREGHGGVVFGSELSGGIENVTVTKCVFEGTDRGFRIKTRRGRGRAGKCGGVTFSDIVMKDVKVPFVINMYYNMGDNSGHTEYVWSTESLPVDERTPEIGSFTFKNTVCTGVEYCAGAFYGLPEAPVKQIIFDNVSFSYNQNCEAGFPDMRERNEKVKNQGLYFFNVEYAELKNVTVTGQNGAEIITENVKEVKK